MHSSVQLNLYHVNLTFKALSIEHWAAHKTEFIAARNLRQLDMTEQSFNLYSTCPQKLFGGTEAILGSKQNVWGKKICQCSYCFIVDNKLIKQPDHARWNLIRHFFIQWSQNSDTHFVYLVQLKLLHSNARHDTSWRFWFLSVYRKVLIQLTAAKCGSSHFTTSLFILWSCWLFWHKNANRITN